MSPLALTARAAAGFEPLPPVFSFHEAAPLLRRPFTERAVKVKTQAAWPKGNPTDALIVTYVDARLVSERLNHVCPTLWSEDFEDAGPGLLLCKLTVDGITRRDVGSGYKGKGLYSDALKRAAVRFGVGVSLYATPKIILKSSDGHVRLTTSQDGKSLALTDNGEARCRELYRAWLLTHGERVFGPALDHGDVEGSVGDLEGDQPPEQTPLPAALNTPAERKLLRDSAEGLTKDRVKMVLAAHQIAPGPTERRAFENVPSDSVTSLCDALVGALK